MTTNDPGPDRFVFLVLTWAPGEDGRAVYGPFPVRPDGGHLDDVTARFRRWSADNPRVLVTSAELFLTVSAQGEGR